MADTSLQLANMIADGKETVDQFGTNNRSARRKTNTNQDFKPVYQDHYFGGEQFGDWLFKLTGVDPHSPGPNDRHLADFTEDEWEVHIKTCKLSKELHIEKQYISATELVKEMLKEFRDKGVFKGIILPFEQTNSNLKGVELQHIEDINLNYGKEGVGGAQRMPKPRHVAHIIRKWAVDGLTVGLARKSPTTEEFFVNEGQHRILAGAIVGRRHFALQYIESDNQIVDIIQFGRENQGKLTASVWEVMANNAVMIINQVEEECRRIKRDPDAYNSMTYEEVIKLCNLSPKSDSFIDYKIVREICLKEGLTIVNDGSPNASQSGHCASPKQLQEIYSQKAYTDEMRSMAVDIYLTEWRHRQFKTADLIGIVENLYYNWDWIQLLSEKEKRTLKANMAFALKTKIPDDARSAGLREIINKRRGELYPKKGSNGAHAELYAEEAPRVSECMWIATGFYEVLSQHIEMESWVDRLVKPTSPSGFHYDLGIEIAHQYRINKNA
jgi:hypothetical protein